VQWLHVRIGCCNALYDGVQLVFITERPVNCFTEIHFVHWRQRRCANQSTAELLQMTATIVFSYNTLKRSRVSLICMHATPETANNTQFHSCLLHQQFATVTSLIMSKPCGPRITEYWNFYRNDLIQYSRRNLNIKCWLLKRYVQFYNSTSNFVRDHTTTAPITVRPCPSTPADSPNFDRTLRSNVSQTLWSIRRRRALTPERICYL